MKTASYKYHFDENAGKLAALSPDGRVRLWETGNGKLCNEWMPQSSLQITCSCLCWAYNAENGRSRPKKESRKRSITDHDSKSHLALGTLQGSVLLLDTGNFEVKNTLVHGHTERINDVCYNSVKDTFYSGSNDKFIMEWAFPSMTLRSKWKADKHSVTKLEASPDGSCLLTAGRSIKLWDLDTKQLLQKFTGHTNPISSLHFVPLSNSRSYKEDCYFLSTAEEDQIVNAWHFDPSCPEKGAVSCFMTPDVPVAVDLAVSEEQQLQLGVACLDGRVNIFKHVLNGKLTKPINSSLKFQIVKHNDEEKTSKSLRLMAFKLLPDQVSVLLVYGSSIRPTFERIKLTNLENGSKLERKVLENLLNEDSVSRKSKKTEERAVIIDTNAAAKKGTVAHKKLHTTAGDGAMVQKQELTLEERLQAIVTPVPQTKRSRNKNERPNAASLAQMLAQGIHSDDDKLIDNVLYKANKEVVITSTVKRLSSSSVMTLINKVVHRIQRNPTRGYELTIWIRVLMSVHMTYLISMPNLMNSLSALYQTLDSRTKVYPKLSKLHGRLDLLLTHATQRQSNAVEFEDVAKPLLFFEDKVNEPEDEVRLSASQEDDDGHNEEEDADFEFDDSDDDDDDSLDESIASEGKDDKQLSDNELESDYEKEDI